jgi:hypothetical protein
MRTGLVFATRVEGVQPEFRRLSQHYLVLRLGVRQNSPAGEMAERLNALVLKTSKV